jgi:CheY-like chemotaxis protein
MDGAMSFTLASSKHSGAMWFSLANTSGSTHTLATTSAFWETPHHVFVESEDSGYAGRVSVPNLHGFSGLAVFSSVAARFLKRERRRMKVLVVEAEDVVLKATGLMLNKLGYEVGLAPDCDEAFRIYCNRGPYDVVLIALKFVRGSSAGGAKFIDALRQKNPEQKFAFMTGAPVLKKPFSLQELDDFMGAFRRPAHSRFG